MFRELGIHHVITPFPLQTEYPVSRLFVDRWTDPDPAGITCGRFALRELRAEARPPAEPARAGDYDDLDERIEYEGAWSHDNQFYQSWQTSITYSNVPGDTLRFWFDGTAIVYVYTKAANRGMAQVSIDGRKMPPIDLYSAVTEWQAQKVFDKLAPGSHRIEVRVLEGKDPGSAGYYVDLDRFIVR
jgi:hypothetical protein